MGWAEKIMVVLHFIEITFVLNILWIIGFVMGLGLFGAFPSTRSVFLLINQGVLTTHDERTLKEIITDFFQLYRHDFKSTNKFAIIYVAIYATLMFDFNAVAIMPVKIRVFFLTLLIILLFYVFLTNVYLLMNEQIVFGKVLFKKIMIMPMAFPIASVLFFIFVVILSLITIRFSFIFVAFYFSSIVLIQEYFLNENIRRHLATKNE